MEFWSFYQRCFVRDRSSHIAPTWIYVFGRPPNRPGRFCHRLSDCQHLRLPRPNCRCDCALCSGSSGVDLDDESSHTRLVCELLPDGSNDYHQWFGNRGVYEVSCLRVSNTKAAADVLSRWKIAGVGFLYFVWALWWLDIALALLISFYMMYIMWV